MKKAFHDAATVSGSVMLCALIAFLHLASAQSRQGDAGDILFRTATDRLETARRAVRLTGNEAAAEADVARAEQEFSRAAAEFSSGGRPEQAVFAVLRSADCLRMLQRWSDARQRYDHVIAEAQRAGRADYEAKAWFGIEKIERLGRRDHGSAVTALERARRLAESSDDLATLRAELQTEMADLEMSAGNVDRALELLTRTVETSASLDDKSVRMIALFIRSSAHHALSQRLFDIYVNLPYATAQEWRRCEQVEGEMRDHIADATDDLHNSQSLAKETGYEFLANGIRDQLSVFRAVVESYDRATSAKKAAHDSAPGAPAVPETPSEIVWHRQGKLVEVTIPGPPLPVDRPEDVKKVVEIIRRQLAKQSDNASTRWLRRYMEGQLLEAERNVPAAIEKYKESATLIERERLTLRDDSARAAFTAEKMQVFNRLVLNLLSRREFGEAFRWNEQARARTMAEMLELAARQLPSERERQLLAQLTAARAENHAVLGRDSSDAAQAAAETRYNEVLNRIRAEAPRLLDLIESPQESLERLRQVMRERQFDLVYYLLHGGNLVIWHIAPERTEVRAYFAPASELQRLATALNASLATRSVPFAADAARDLYFFLVAPIVASLETRHIVVVAPPTLENVPFAALLDPHSGKYLGETHAISYVPSASVLVRLRPGTRLERAKVLAFVGPDLQYGEQDAEAIARTYPQHVIVRPAAATRSSLMQQAVGRRVVHFAAHGKYNADQPMSSYIQLRPEAGDDGRLTASEMMGLPLAGVDLVTVGSCTAARVKAGQGHEIYGITRSLLYAGAQNVLLPLWEVDDQAASVWLTAFYGAARDAPLAEAVHLANVALMRHAEYGAHPRFWSAFKLFGH